MANATRTKVTTDTMPKWLRPLPPMVGEILGVKIDPALRVDPETAYLLEQDSQPLTAETTVFMTSNFETVLAAEVIVEGSRDPFILIRAATGDEAAYLLDTDDEEEEEAQPEDGDGDESVSSTVGQLGAMPARTDAAAGADRPGRVDREIDWRAEQDSPEITESGVVLWAGEVLLNTGRGMAGPFYTHETAAKAWAFSTALSLPEAELFGAQVVGYRCARSQAAGLLADGDAEFRRLNRFWSSPVRQSSVLPIALPGRHLDADDEAI